MNQTTLSSPVSIDGLAASDCLSRAQAGDSEAFDRLTGPLRERLVRQAYALCRDESQAQDLAQETLMEAWKSMHRFNGQCQLETWLCSILLHRHQSLLRRAWWRTRVVSWRFGNAHNENATDPVATPDEAAQLSDRSMVILATLDRLSNGQRQVIFLRFYADESLEGIAATLNCSVGTVKSRLFHGLKNLRRINILKEEQL